MKKFNFIYCSLLTVLFLCFAAAAFCQDGTMPPKTPVEAYEKAINNPEFVKNARKGEGFCWHARGAMDQFVTNYKTTKNREWLESGMRYCDFLIGRMDVSPDGYKGWVGPYFSDTRYWQDVLVGDALLFDGILDLCILINEDSSLKRKYGTRASAYIALAKKDFVEKYDKRDTWKEDGPYGGYVNSGNFLKEGDLNKWIYAPNTAEVAVSHPFNKQMDAGLVCVKLYRVTGDKFYWDRAQRIFFTAKSHFQYFDDHYCWNYYEPLYPGDVNLEKKDTRHGIWVHPWRSGYQASEVDKIVEAYHYGLVFDEQDIKRIINTNLQVMWNKDRINPKFINSNGLGADGDTSGIADFQRAYGHSNVVKNGGELWTGLLDFDQTVRDLYELQFKGDTISHRWLTYKNTVLVSPPSFKRKYALDGVKVPLVHFTESRDLSCAVVLPYLTKQDAKSVLVCKSWKGGDLQIDLYEKERKLLNIFSGKIGEGIFIKEWDGKDAIEHPLPKGEYTIRWTINDGYREFPVLIK